MFRDRANLKWVLAAAGFLATIIVVPTLLRHRPEPPAPTREIAARFFTDRYPAQNHFQQELQLMRSQGKLSAKNEARISTAVEKTSGELKMPPAVLWCLLFQESRLNHLEGLGSERGALGIGQFSFFSFYEVNHHLSRFNGDNLSMFKKVLGKDVRPLLPDENNLDSPSSYFSIPTAVAASGAYLNNRYHQLRAILDRRQLTYQPDLLWLYAAMAYNKGTRSVLSLWKDSQRRQGPAYLQQILVDNESFRASVSNPRTVLRTLKRIWPADQAEAYAQELRIHLQNMWDCSVAQKTAATETTPREGAKF